MTPGSGVTDPGVLSVQVRGLCTGKGCLTAVGSEGIKIMKRLCSVLLCALIILNMAACGPAGPETTKEAPPETVSVPESTKETPAQTGPSQPEPETEAVLDKKDAPKICTKKTYGIAMPSKKDPDRVIILDEQGAVLDNVTIPIALCDVITGNLRYYTVVEYEKDGSLKASWLYSAKGKALEGSSNCVYGDCLGSLVVKTLRTKAPGPEADPASAAEDASWLYDPVKKAAVEQNVFSVEKLTGKKAVCLDAKRRVLGAYDREGQKLSEAPFEGSFTCGYCCGGFVLGYPESGCAVLNEELETVQTAPKMFDMELLDCGAQGVICIKKENNVCQVYRADDWKLRGTFPADLQTTDGLNAICGDDFSKNVNLHSIRGKRLAGPFDKISLLRDESDLTIGMTLARKDNVVYVLNKYGSTVAQRRIYGLTRAYNTFDGLIMCEYEFENDWTGEKETGYALLEQRLKWVSSRDYHFVRLERVTKDVYSGTRQNGEHSWRTDLYDEKGEVIFRKAVRFGTADENAIAVCGQEYFGLIDHRGNWIARLDLPEDLVRN